MKNTIIWKRFLSTNYSVSNTGLVKNINTNRLLSGGINIDGYRFVVLYIDHKRQYINVHTLVGILFLGFIPDGNKHVIHHDDGNKLNNHKDNLKIVTFRFNCSVERTAKSSSLYTGVTWYKNYNKWRAAIRIKGKLKHLGYFINELDAHKAYQDSLLSLIE